MTPTQIDLVRSSFARVVPMAAITAAIFYDKLFALDPALSPLFEGDMYEQGRRLMQMIAAAVNELDRIDQLLPVVRDLGRRHAAYGVQPQHYDTVAIALLSTLENSLGTGFTPEVGEAWSETYAVIAMAMKGAAYPVSVA